jgi:site-specific DNA-methyltransferase (adenine-specific)
MEELYRQGRIVQTRPGAVPQYKRYLDEMPGVPVQNIWTDIPVINNRSREKLGYPTQKPEALLERIIKTTSNEGDIILDAYCGCGTTIAVAQRLNRRWIGMDITYQAIATILARLEDQFGKVVADSHGAGIELLHWRTVADTVHHLAARFRGFSGVQGFPQVAGKLMLSGI